MVLLTYQQPKSLSLFIFRSHKKIVLKWLTERYSYSILIADVFCCPNCTWLNGGGIKASPKPETSEEQGGQHQSVALLKGFQVMVVMFITPLWIWCFLLLRREELIFLSNRRSTLQTKSKQADYAEDDFEMIEEVPKSKWWFPFWNLRISFKCD